MNRLKRTHPGIFLPSSGGGVSSKLSEEGLSFVTEELRKGVPPEGVGEAASTFMQQVLAEQSPAMRRTVSHTAASPATGSRPRAAPGMGSAARPQESDRKTRLPERPLGPTALGAAGPDVPAQGAPTTGAGAFRAATTQEVEQGNDAAREHAEEVMLKARMERLERDLERVREARRLREQTEEEWK